MSVLIVDDDNRRGDLLQQYLVNSGVVADIDIWRADCADRARAILKSQYFDVLILDVVLPKRPGEIADAENGLNLLEQVSRSTLYRKPEKILGITAFGDDIQRFRSRFELHCFLVIEARAGDEEWRSRIVDALSYTASSKLAREDEFRTLHCIAIHGIRTFGQWQLRLNRLATGRYSGIECHSYSYGYFSVLAFLLPPLRWIEVRRLASHLSSLCYDAQPKEIIAFAHSFGTYLLAKSLLRLKAKGVSIPVVRIVLSGSVLPSTFDWSKLTAGNSLSVINDCADDDTVLLFSEAVVLGMGMAGRTGFVGFNNKRLTNRFFKGGHSGYFQGDKFMERSWLPLLHLNDDASQSDGRDESVFRQEIVNKVASFLGYVKPLMYFILLGAIVYSFFTT